MQSMLRHPCGVPAARCTVTIAMMAGPACAAARVSTQPALARGGGMWMPPGRDRIMPQDQLTSIRARFWRPLVLLAKRVSCFRLLMTHVCWGTLRCRLRV